MCEEFVLQDIYNFLKALLKTEFKYICQRIITKADLELKDKKKKIRRKTINIITGVTQVEDNNQQHLENIVISSNPCELQILETAEEIQEEIQDLKPAKKQRKPRKSKKDVTLEIVEEV
jgi:uncharacterized protein YbbC (DUF1343 family)